MDQIQSALSQLPPAQYAVGVSGGADSVALLHSLVQAGFHPHIIHLNHQLRAEESTADATFVQQLAHQLNLPCTIETLSNLESRITIPLPANPSARYRALRLSLFREVCQQHQLAGLLLAHHADDQAETILQRLLRGSSIIGLTGMAEHSTLPSLSIHRPLLSIRRQTLRDYLIHHHHPWREDSSNTSAKYQRNRARMILQNNEPLTLALLDFAHSARHLRDWVKQSSPTLPKEFRIDQVRNLPSLLAKQSIRTWLIHHAHLPWQQAESSIIDRVLHLTQDLALPPLLNIPGGRLKRSQGTLKPLIK